MNTFQKRFIMGNTAKGLGPVLLLSAALALPVAATAQPSRYGYGTPYSGRGGTRSVDGFITYRGGSCPAIRDHRSGQSYSLAGGTRELRPGDHVVLGGRLASGSVCGTRGPALQVLEIRTIWTGGDHRAAYFDARRDGSFDRFILRSRDRGGWYSDRYTYLRQGRAQRGAAGTTPPTTAPVRTASHTTTTGATIRVNRRVNRTAGASTTGGLSRTIPMTMSRSSIPTTTITSPRTTPTPMTARTTARTIARTGVAATARWSPWTARSSSTAPVRRSAARTGSPTIWPVSWETPTTATRCGCVASSRGAPPAAARPSRFRKSGGGKIFYRR